MKITPFPAFLPRRADDDCLQRDSECVQRSLSLLECFVESEGGGHLQLLLMVTFETLR